MSRIVRVNQYTAAGMCLCLGNLFVTASSTGQWEPPALFRLAGGSAEVVLRVGVPLQQGYGGFWNSSLGVPVSSGQYVYFGVINPQILGVTNSNYVGAFDVLRGSYWHWGNNAIGSLYPAAGIRNMTAMGRSVVYRATVASNASFVFQTDNSRLGATTAYATAGTLVSSRLDFNTPGITKQFRRVTVHHSDLPTGASVAITIYVDQDPVNYPGTSAATVTTTTAGARTTELTLPSSTQGHSMYFMVRLTPSTANNVPTSTPVVYYVACEVTVPWVWEFTVDCTSRRQSLQGNNDPQALLGKDLYYLLHNAWESAQPVTFYHPNGTSYPAIIETLEFTNPSPMSGTTTPLKVSDNEWWAHVVLRNAAV